MVRFLNTSNSKEKLSLKFLKHFHPSGLGSTKLAREIYKVDFCFKHSDVQNNDQGRDLDLMNVLHACHNVLEKHINWATLVVKHKIKIGIILIIVNNNCNEKLQFT